MFGWVLKLLGQKGLLKGKTLGVDATTLEANAAMRSIVRRDTADSYGQFLTKLAQASGIATPTREDLARIDKTCKNQASNDDWTNPHDPDARITKTKDGRTHLAHKAEHSVDLDTGVIVFGIAKPRRLQDVQAGDNTGIFGSILGLLAAIQTRLGQFWRFLGHSAAPEHNGQVGSGLTDFVKMLSCSTGC
ncbi:MAG: hypothetical protein ACE15C_14190 [Phycisphaerae bacterium]